MDPGWLLLDSDPLGLGFLGPWPFRRENPNVRLLDSLGFPWILSSESRLINGLCRINRAEVFHAPSSLRAAPERDAAVEAMRKGRIGHGDKLISVSDFSQLNVVRAFPLGRLNPKATRFKIKAQLAGSVSTRKQASIRSPNNVAMGGQRTFDIGRGVEGFC
jgi:hypothetical protein